MQIQKFIKHWTIIQIMTMKDYSIRLDMRITKRMIRSFTSLLSIKKKKEKIQNATVMNYSSQLRFCTKILTIQ